MPDISPQQLATINLKFSSSARPLKVIAFSDLASKGLFLIGRPAGVRFLASEVAKIIGIKSVDEKLIEKALEVLRAENKAYMPANSKKWVLTDEMKQKIDSELKSSVSDLDGVLDRNFPKTVDREKLKSWFIQAAADFFGFNGAEWVKSVCRNIKTSFSKSTTTEQLLETSIKKYSLAESRESLVKGFNGFLTSDDIADQKYLMDLGHAMFSAQLVAADVGADPITIEEIRNSTFILDTNILFAVNLETHRLAKSMHALGQALSQINSKLHYLNTTKEEYKRVIHGRRGSVLSLLDIYPEEVVIDSDDDFMKTAKRRKCQNREDIESFLESIKNPPTQVSTGAIISILDNSEIEDIAKKAEIDASLKALIQQNYVKLRFNAEEGKQKSEAALNHDASLVRTVEHLRQTERKTWVLTLDRSLQATSLERAGRHDIPVSFFLDGLIQILAVNNGGPSQNASDFAPLLASIIMNRCNPAPRTYTPQDLQQLYSIQERVTDFGADRIKKIVSIVSANRLAGMMADDERMELAVNRAYQEEKRSYEQELETAKERARSAEHESETKTKIIVSRTVELRVLRKNELIRKGRIKLSTSLAWRIPVALLIGIIVYFLAASTLPYIKMEGIMDYILSIFAFIGFGYGLVKNPVQNYREHKKKIDSTVNGEFPD